MDATLQHRRDLCCR